MKIIILILILFQSLTMLGQNFESADTDTLYTIKDFKIKHYQRERERIRKYKKEILSKNIKSITRIYTQNKKDDTKITSKNIMNYDTNGYLIRQKYTGRYPTLRIFKYDSLSNRVEETKYNEENIILEKKIREFDRFSNQIYNYHLKENIEKIDLTNELLPNGIRIIKDSSRSYNNTFYIDTNGVMHKYIMSYKMQPKRKPVRISGSYYGIQIDTTFEEPEGTFQEIQKFFYEKGKLIKIETYERFKKSYTKIAYKKVTDHTFLIDTSYWVDTGGLTRIREFQYSEEFLVESIDTYYKNGRSSTTIRYQYDEKGRLTQKIHSRDKTFKVKYDNNNNIVNKSYIREDSIFWQKNYSFDKNNNLIYSSFEQDSLIYEMFREYYSSGVLSNQKKITYTCFECEYVDQDLANSYPRVEIIKYNQFGKPTEKLFYTSQIKLIRRETTVYNDSLPILSKRFENGIEISRNELSYDNMGNCILNHIQKFNKNYDYQWEIIYEFYE